MNVAMVSEPLAAIALPGLGKAFAARHFTPRVQALLRDRFELVQPVLDVPMTSAALLSHAKGCEHIFVSVTEQVDAAAIDGLAPELRTIATLSVGSDHIDLAAARRHDIQVLTTPDVLSPACAETAMLLLLAAARRGREADQLVRSGLWTGWAPTQMLGRTLVGMRLGILGMGRIGRELAVRARAFGMEVHYHNRNRLAADLEGDAQYHATITGLLQHSDALCLCASGGSGLTRIIDAAAIELLPDHAIVVNIARGDLIDDDALIAGLESHKLFAAGLDVFDGEPDVNPRYLSLENVVFSPHIGSATVETRDAMGMMLIAGIEAIARGDRPQNQIS